MALPATDAFTGTGALSANWTEQTADGTWERVSDQARMTARWTQGVYWNADSFNNEHYSQIKYAGNISASTWGGPGVRMQAGVRTLYALRMTTATECVLAKCVSDSWSTLATFTPPTINAGDLLKLQATGTATTTLTATIAGSGQTPYDDSASPLANGAAGFCGFESDTPVATYTIYLDDWEGGDVGGGGGGTILPMMMHHHGG